MNEKETKFTVFGYPFVLRVTNKYDYEIHADKESVIHFYFRFFTGDSKGFRVRIDPEIGIYGRDEVCKNVIKVPLIGLPHTNNPDYETGEEDEKKNTVVQDKTGIFKKKNSFGEA